MNTKLTVKKTADTNYIPVKYGVIEIEVNSTAATTYCVLQCIRIGWDTQAHYEAWVSTWDGATKVLHGREVEGIQGALGVLEITTLDAIEIYDAQTPSRDM